MNSVRAYNMNLKELIHPDQNRSLVSDPGTVANDSIKTLKADNDVSLSAEATNANSVQVDISPVWQQVADKIDLKNAASSEVADFSASLFKAGTITFEDHINLSFQKDPLDDKKIDVIAHWQSEQEKATQRGAHHEDLNDIIRIQSILAYVDSLK